MAKERDGTRINCAVPFTLTSLDPAHSFSEPCLAILANLQGCAARCGSSLRIGTAVQLDGLPMKRKVTAHIVNCFWPGEFAKFWMVGLALDEPGNVWGVESPPDDWSPKPLPTEQIVSRALILCLEDNPTHLALRKKVLEREGNEIISVATAAEALKALRNFDICAIITDHLLQGTTGTHLAREMKKIKPQVPIILFSGTIPPHLNDVDVYINKAEPAAKFLGIVRAIVERHRS